MVRIAANVSFVALVLGAGLTGGAVPPAPNLAPIGSQIVAFGDGTMAENANPGLRCPITWMMFYLNGRLMPAPGMMQCASGGDMDTIYARCQYANGFQADIFLFASQGHNDGLMTTDPDSSPSLMDKWKRNLDAVIAANPNALYIPVCSTLPSNVGGETTASSFNPAISRRQRVWQIQQAYVAAKNNPRIFYVATGEAYNPNTMSSDTVDSQTHMDERGGAAIGLVLANAIGTYVVAATKEEILAMIDGGTYPGLEATNFDANGSLAGTTGTLAGTVAPTGQYATGKRITNNLTNGTSVAVVVSKDNSAAKAKQVAVISGTPAADATIVQDSSSNVSSTGTPGSHFLLSFGMLIDNGAGAAPVGLKTLSVAYGNYGFFGLSSSNPSLTYGSVVAPIDTVVMTPPRPGGGHDTTYAGAPALATRWAGSTALTGRVVLDRINVRKISTRTKSAPMFYGNDGLQPANSPSQLRLTGTLVSGAGTLRIDPGAWAPYGLTNTDHAERRIYKGGTAGNAGIGSGTLVATLSGGTWSWVTSGIVAGDTLYCEVTVNNGIGGNVVQRSETVYTAA